MAAIWEAADECEALGPPRPLLRLPELGLLMPGVPMVTGPDLIPVRWDPEFWLPLVVSVPPVRFPWPEPTMPAGLTVVLTGVLTRFCQAVGCWRM